MSLELLRLALTGTTTPPEADPDEPVVGAEGPKDHIKVQNVDLGAAKPAAATPAPVAPTPAPTIQNSPRDHYIASAEIGPSWSLGALNLGIDGLNANPILHRNNVLNFGVGGNFEAQVDNSQAMSIGASYAFNQFTLGPTALANNPGSEDLGIGIHNVAVKGRYLVDLFDSFRLQLAVGAQLGISYYTGKTLVAGAPFPVQFDDVIPFVAPEASLTWFPKAWDNVAGIQISANYYVPLNTITLSGLDGSPDSQISGNPVWNLGAGVRFELGNK